MTAENPATALDKEIAQSYVAFLIENTDVD